MGSAMAQNLIDADHELHVYNRNRERAEPLRKSGATVALTPALAAHSAGVVFPWWSTMRRLRLVHTGKRALLRGCTHRPSTA
jgi:3-hydroxyisobutyrate dehydrogenase